MPLLLTKQIDRSIFSLNDSVYGIFFDDVNQKSASPHTRWARGQHRMLPITAYESPDKPLVSATFQRDRAVLTSQSTDIFGKLREGSIVIMSVEEYDSVMSTLTPVSPLLASMLQNHVTRWMEF